MIKGRLTISSRKGQFDTAINDNPNIERVVYFSASDEDTSAAQKVINKPLQIRNVFNYWKSIGC